MSHRRVIVILTDASATAVRVDTSHPWVARRDIPLPDSLFALAGTEEIAARIKEAVNDAEALELPVTLVVPLNWAFTHVLHAGKRLSEESLAFEFESFLPVPLEDLTCAFLRRGDVVLGVAVPTEPLGALLSAIERVGPGVEHVFLDVVTLASNERNRAADMVILDERWRRGFRSALGEAPTFFLEPPSSGRPLVLPEDRTASDSDGQPCEVLDVRRSGRETVTLSGVQSVLLESDASCARVARAAAAMEDGDLRLGALALRGRWSHVQRRAQLALVGVMLLLVGVLAGLRIRSQALKEQLAALETTQLAVYRQVSPVEQLPAGATLRLASERKRLEGLTRPGSPAPPGSSRASAAVALESLDVLRCFVAELPDDVRVFLEQARLDEDQVSLRGRTTEHRDAERIVEALAKVPGIATRPPRTTRRSDGGVEFSILARRSDHE